VTGRSLRICPIADTLMARGRKELLESHAQFRGRPITETGLFMAGYRESIGESEN
jgi:hypothetical protein